MASPYIIRISSQKGGVGKTVVAVNLGVALSLLNYKVLLVDTDTANPSMGAHLGLTHANAGFREVVTGKEDLNDVIAFHAPSGCRIIPGTINAYSFTPKPADLRRFVSELAKTDFDFIIIDTAPGVSSEEPYDLYSEALIITTPETTSCISAIRLARKYTETKLNHNMVINRVKNKRYEFSTEEIENMYEKRALAVIPEDESVPVSISEHIPAYMTNDRSNFSRQIRILSRRYSSRMGNAQFEIEQGTKKRSGEGIIAFIKRLLHL